MQTAISRALPLLLLHWSFWRIIKQLNYPHLLTWSYSITIPGEEASLKINVLLHIFHFTLPMSGFNEYNKRSGRTHGIEKLLSLHEKLVSSTFYRTTLLDSEIVYFKPFSKHSETLNFERQTCDDIKGKPLLASIGCQSSWRQMVTQQGFLYSDFSTVLKFHKNEEMVTLFTVCRTRNIFYKGKSPL